MTEPKTPEAPRDLRAAVEGLRHFELGWPSEDGRAGLHYGPAVERAAVLALIPPGSVVVTAETLAEALDATWEDVYETGRWTATGWSAAILARLQAKP